MERELQTRFWSLCHSKKCFELRCGRLQREVEDVQVSLCAIPIGLHLRRFEKGLDRSERQIRRAAYRKVQKGWCDGSREVLDDFHGISGVALSVPSIVNASGAFPVRETPFDAEELELLRSSAEALRSVDGSLTE